MRERVALLHGHCGTAAAQKHKQGEEQSQVWVFLDDFLVGSPLNTDISSKGNRIENRWHHLRHALRWGTANTERWMFLASRELWWGEELNKSLRCLFSHPERSPDPRLKGNTTSQGWTHHAWVLPTHGGCTTTSTSPKHPPQHGNSSPWLPLEPLKPVQSTTSWLY